MRKAPRGCADLACATGSAVGPCVGGPISSRSLHPRPGAARGFRAHPFWSRRERRVSGRGAPGFLSWDAAALGAPSPGAGTVGRLHRGAEAYALFCARCHGPGGAGGSEAGSIVDAAYLGLVSDQALRTAVIVGRKDLGMPDWRDAEQLSTPVRPMSAAEVRDVVAWIASHRPPKGH